jgi:uncharacterized protein YqgV (UPF0045/DUF77 family)
VVQFRSAVTRVRAEFTIYPFIEGMALPSYVQAAIDTIRDAGLDVEVGALSNIVVGDAERVLEALRAAEAAALQAGATRVVISLECQQ